MLEKIRSFLRTIFSPRYFPIVATSFLLTVGSLSLFSLIRDRSIEITKENIIARVSPSTDAEQVGQLVVQQEYPILNEKDGWYQIPVDSRTNGWFPTWMLEFDQLSSDQNMAAHTLIKTPLYAEKDKESEVLVTIPRDRYVTVSNESQGWLRVTYDNQTGYVETRAVALLDRDKVPNIDPRDLDDEYDPQAIQKARQEAEPIAVVRYNGEPFLPEPNLFTSLSPFYTTTYGQTFKFLEEVTSPNDSSIDFMKVEDSDGQVGYLESRITALESNSIGHVTDRTASSIEKAVIMIDAGHGGEDVGATNLSGNIYEKNLTLTTSLKLKEKLEAAGAKVILTRETDEFIELSQRREMSNQEQVDLFISIHYDRGVDELRGTTTYYYHEFDRSLAEQMNQAISALPLPNNGVRFGNYQVLRENTRQALLLELGYMSSNEDVNIIQNAGFQDQLSSIITNTIVNYFNAP